MHEHSGWLGSSSARLHPSVVSGRGRRQRRSHDDSEGVVRDIGFGKRCEDSTNLEEIKTERKEGGEKQLVVS